MITKAKAQRKSDQESSMRGGAAVRTGEPMRPCSRCGRNFQPNVIRRMLCLSCYKNGESFAEPRNHGIG